MHQSVYFQEESHFSVTTIFTVGKREKICKTREISILRGHSDMCSLKSLNLFYLNRINNPLRDKTEVLSLHLSDTLFSAREYNRELSAGTEIKWRSNPARYSYPIKEREGVAPQIYLQFDTLGFMFTSVCIFRFIPIPTWQDGNRPLFCTCNSILRWWNRIRHLRSYCM